MQRINRLAKSIKANITELWLGILLFLAIPGVVGLYTDYRGFLAISFIAQAVVIILSYRNTR